MKIIKGQTLTNADQIRETIHADREGLGALRFVECRFPEGIYCSVIEGISDNGVSVEFDNCWTPSAPDEHREVV